MFTNIRIKLWKKMDSWKFVGKKGRTSNWQKTLFQEPQKQPLENVYDINWCTCRLKPNSKSLTSN